MPSGTAPPRVSRAEGLRVLLVGRFVPGTDGEWKVPLHLFRVLRARGVEAWLVILYEHTAGALRALLPDADEDRLLQVGRLPETQRVLRFGARFPRSVISFSCWKVVDFCYQLAQRKRVEELVRAHRIDVVHQPIPVCPRQPRALHDVGAPVVLGPVSGFLPPAPWYRERERASLRRWIWQQVRHAAARALHLVFPGIPRAAVVLVANPWSAKWLPACRCAKLVSFTEGGVDVDLWRPGPRAGPFGPDVVHFVSSGRMVAGKRIDVTIDALHRVRERVDAGLVVVGSGPMEAALAAQVEALRLGDRVRFTGWLDEVECARTVAGADVFVHSSLLEAGPQVVVEAMACGLPVIGVDWGGIPIRVGAETGILLAPRSREEHVEQLAGAMLALASSAGRRRCMGEAARARVLREFDWNRRVETLLEIYADCVAQARAPGLPVAGRGRNGG